METKLKYFIYARKSSEGADRQILSIEGQLNALKKIVQRDNCNVVDVYTESKSAHVPNNRPKFNEMIRRINKGHANGIIVWHINRVSRNPKESGEIQQMLQDGKIVSIITPYRNFRSEDNALLFSIETSEANQYSRDLSVNVKRGLKLKYEMGQPPGVALLGYLNTKSTIKGSNKIIPDPERWSIMRKGFDLLLSGAYTIAQVLDILINKYGLRTRPVNDKPAKIPSRSTFYNMITNPAYAGIFHIKGVVYKGAYKAIITLDEFDRLQIILGRKGNPRSKRHTFTYTGLMKCGSCGGSVTATKKQKLLRTTGQLKIYVFYHCTHRKKKDKICNDRYCIPGNDLEEMIIEELKSYQIREPFKKWAVEFAKSNFENENSKNEELIVAHAKQENSILRQLDVLVELRLTEGIGEAAYLQKKTEKEQELIRVQSKKKDLEEQIGDWLKNLENHLSFAVDIVERFRKSDQITKKEICYDFGSNWVLKDKKLLIDKAGWLEPIKKYKEGVESVLNRFEPKKTSKNTGFKVPVRSLRPLVLGLLDEVRTEEGRETKDKAD